MLVGYALVLTPSTLQGPSRRGRGIVATRERTAQPQAEATTVRQSY